MCSFIKMEVREDECYTCNKNEIVLFCDVEFFINVPLFLTPGQPLWGLVMFR